MPYVPESWLDTEPDDIVDELRSFELDHDQDGWPAVRMSQISSACDEIERLREWKNKAAEVMARFVSLSSHPEPMSWGETASDATKLLVDRGD